MENNWKHKTLENLEKNIWPKLNADENSYLIITCNNLRKKNLIDFTIEDLRIMIGQSIGLKFLIPIAIEELQKNILAEGHFFEGDLLNSVLNSDTEYWKADKDNWKTVCEIFQKSQDILKDEVIGSGIRKKLFSSFNKFYDIN